MSVNKEIEDSAEKSRGTNFQTMEIDLLRKQNKSMFNEWQ